MRQLLAILSFLASLPGLLLIGVIRTYQKWISPMLGPRCRFQPTCSEYVILAVRKYGLLKGVLRGVWRVCRCHPWSEGGYDPP
ncbi:MAG: membrane protein insertion efficiency factor YidD [Pirellulaceae bacterium]|nr:membrane protein insertion efficiency factor YidD [Pirellulaceae bacterium]